MQTKDFILASGSPQRRALLESIGMFPKDIRPAGIDETPFSGEEPLPYIRRMALSKAQAAAAAIVVIFTARSGVIPSGRRRILI